MVCWCISAPASCVEKRASLGKQGLQGNDGSTGPQGPPGAVSLTQLNTVITGASSNSNMASTLDNGFADPDLETLRLAYNTLVVALRR